MKRQLLIILLLSVVVSNEISFKEISLKGQITDPKQEISGMDWYKNQLVLLPENLGGFLYMISKQKIFKSIDSSNPQSIEPKKTVFTTPDYSKFIPGFEGLEAIAFNKNDVYITIEANDGGQMQGYLAWGNIDPNTHQVTIPKQNLLKLETPVQIKNMAFESLLIYKNSVIAIYEAQGINLQKSVWQYQISLDEKSVTKINFPNVEYRINDVTRLNKANKFWAINYLWVGDKKYLKPGKDLLMNGHKKGKTHTDFPHVERLIEFTIDENSITLTDSAPIQLKLDKNDSRNWEGIVRLDNKGFLITTDKYPRMILGFVPINIP